ncbi:MAG: HEAT repeat domain-containing protein [Chloroflexi bacterium]|nr:HEAT repeat domain-containing protein [Chloroflexota bacterium]
MIFCIRNQRDQMNERQMQVMLEELKSAARVPAEERIPLIEIWGKMHDLAEAKYDPAISFFLNLLDDTEWDWRQESVTSLGFHYDFSPDGEIADKIRQMVLTDPAPIVRNAAASVLGGRSKWPDQVLIAALKFDPEELVRKAAFASLLELAGVPYKTVNKMNKLLGEGKQQATWEEFKRILSAEGIKLEIPD